MYLKHNWNIQELRPIINWSGNQESILQTCRWNIQKGWEPLLILVVKISVVIRSNMKEEETTSMFSTDYERMMPFSQKVANKLGS